ncbi:unnamed protein product, partial [Ixodes hexagonus]
MGTRIWTSALLFVNILTLTESLSSEHSVVYPRLLESRDASGQKILVVNGDITLHLKPSSVFAEEITVDAIEEGLPVKFYFQGPEYQNNLYHDSQKKASLTIHEDNGVHVEGLIGSTLRIIPAPEMQRSMNGQVAHVLYKVHLRVPQTKYNKLIKNSGPENDNGRHAPFPKERQDGKYVAEVYIVLDKYYAKVFNYSKRKILNYFSRFINMVNVYLESIGSYPLTVKVVGLKISKSRPKYMKKVKGNRDKFLGDETLIRFRKEFGTSPEYRQSDVFMLLTRLDIAEGDDTIFDETVTGSSMVGAACTMYKAGASEDEPYTYDGVYGFVREISHLVGIVDDGKEPNEWIQGNTGARRCPPQEGYIMGTADASNQNFLYNHFQYSWCSQAQFQTFVRTRDCLSKTNFPHPSTTMKMGLRPDNYDMNYICSILHDDYESVKYIQEPARLQTCRFRCGSLVDFRKRSITFDHFVAEGAPC